MNDLIWIVAGFLLVSGISLSRTSEGTRLLLPLLGSGYLIAAGLTGWAPLKCLVASNTSTKRAHFRTHKNKL